MSKKKKEKCNPLIIIIIALVITITVILSVVIALRFANRSKDNEPETHLNPEKLVKKKEKVTDKKVTDKKVTDNDNKTESRNVCESPECITLAHQLHNWRDPSIDPCTDFYKFSCGKYIEHSSSGTNPMREKQEIVIEMIREFLWRNETSTSISENSMRTLYRKCESVKKSKIFKKDLQKTHAEVLKNIQKIGAWPMMMQKKWDSSKFDLNGMLVNMAKMGLRRFGVFEINLESKRSILLTPTRMGVEEQTILDLLSAAKIKFDEDQISDDYDEVMKFYKELSGLADQIDDTLLPLTKLKTSVPIIDFDRILMSFTGSFGLKYADFKKDVKIVNSQWFLGKTKNLQTLLKTTKPSTIANFLIFNYIEMALTFMDLETARESDCAEVVVEFLPQASLRLFVHNFFDRENVNLASEMIDSLKESYIDAFRTSTWISQKTKETAIKKVEAMTKLVAYPEEQKWEEDMEKLHRKLRISPTDTLFKIFQDVQKFRTGNILKALRDGEHSAFYLIDNVLQVNAFYATTMNHIQVMVAFLDDPFFDSTFPNYARIAKIGNVVAHEIGHGFDPNGATFDENADSRDWWHDGDKEEFDKKIGCLEQQYESYDDPDYGRTLNGSLVNGELAADLWGAEVNWRALKKMNVTGEQDIIGFEGHDTDKMYFYITALEFCAPPKNPKYLRKPSKHTHPTDSFRINGVFANLKQFAETFNCPVGSPMNPVKKCGMF